MPDPSAEQFFREQMLAAQARIERSVEVLAGQERIRGMIEELAKEVRTSLSAGQARMAAIEQEIALLRQRSEMNEKAAADAARVAAENKNMSMSTLIGIIGAVSTIIAAIIGGAFEVARNFFHTGHAP
jgi:predicted GTPase